MKIPISFYNVIKKACLQLVDLDIFEQKLILETSMRLTK